MKELKPPTTYEQQIALLRSRNVIISDDKRCKNILSAVNYYRLTAYLLPFKQKSGDYLPETDLENIYQIYEFDRQMRGIHICGCDHDRHHIRIDLHNDWCAH